MKANLEFLPLVILIIWVLVLAPFLVFNFNLKKNTGMPRATPPPPPPPPAHVDLNFDHRKRVLVNTNEPFVEENLNQLKIKKEIKSLIRQKKQIRLLDWFYLKFSD